MYGPQREISRRVLDGGTIGTGSRKMGLRKARFLIESVLELRDRLLLSAISGLGFDTEDISRLAALLRALSGSYDQAARAAAAM